VCRNVHALDIADRCNVNRVDYTRPPTSRTDHPGCSSMGATKPRHVRPTAHLGAASLEACSWWGSHLDILLACHDFCLHLPIVRPAEPRTSCAHGWLTTFRSIVPLWASVIIPQQRELAVMGSQVSHLVHSNWPPVFLPPVLVGILMGSKDGRQAFQHRVNWPWKSIPPLEENDWLVASLGRTTSSIGTAGSQSVECVSPEAARAKCGDSIPVVL
jgi:hypothetical protein